MISKLTDRELLEKIYQTQIIILGRLERMDEPRDYTLNHGDLSDTISDLNSELTTLKEVL